MHHELALRVTGFIASIILTLAAYFIILYPEFFNFDINTAVMVIFTLALIQSIVQLIFFIDVWKKKSSFGILVSFFPLFLLSSSWSIFLSGL